MPLPLYPDIPLNKRPWATLAIIVLCFFLHLSYEINYWDNKELALAITQEEYPAFEDSIPHREFINLEATESDTPTLSQLVQELAFYYLEYPYLERQITEDWLAFEDEFEGSVYNTLEIKASQAYRTWSDEDERHS